MIQRGNTNHDLGTVSPTHFPAAAYAEGKSHSNSNAPYAIRDGIASSLKSHREV